MVRRYNDELAGDMVGRGFRKKLKKKLKKIPKPVKIALNPMSAAKYAPIKNKRLKTLARLAMGDVTAIPSAVKDKKLLKAAINPVSALPIKSNGLKAALGDPFAAASLAKKAAFGSGSSGGSDAEDSSFDEEPASPATAQVSDSGGDDSGISFAETPGSDGGTEPIHEEFPVNDDESESEGGDMEELSGEMVGSIFKKIKSGVKKVAKGTAKVATSKPGIAALSFTGGAGAAIAATKIAQSGVVQNLFKSKSDGGSEEVAQQTTAPQNVSSFPQSATPQRRIAPQNNTVVRAGVPAATATGGFDLKKWGPILALGAGVLVFMRGRA